MKPLHGIGLVTALACAAVAQSSTGSLCGIEEQRNAIVANRLFFCSGSYTFSDNEAWQNTSQLYWLDLTTDFAVDGMIGTDVLNQSALPSGDLSSAARSVSGGASGTFFYDHTNLYAYGGFVGADINGINNSLWTYNTTINTWSLASVDNGSIKFGDNTEGIYATDSATGRSFYTGGWEVSFGSSNDGMVKFSTNNSNDTSFEFANNQGLSTLKGAMVYTRKGTQGTLISFGGDDTTSEGVYNGQTYWNARSMADIYIYDIDSSTWYNITATGDIPGPRTEFCAGVSAAPDDSSIQISIHGGWDQTNLLSLSDVWVLSIPSFQWFKVNATGDPDTTAEAAAGRHRHKCEVWKDRQLIVVGGVVDANGSARNDYCNATSHPPLKVLDTSTYTWQTRFQANSTYGVPDIVYNVIGGNSSGGANVTQPAGGWNSTALESIFNHTVARDTYVVPPQIAITSPSASATSTPSSSSDSSKSHTGAIVGGVIGGLAGLCLISLGGLFWLRQRRRKEAKPKEYLEMGPSEIRHEVEWNAAVEAPAGEAKHELPVEDYIHESPGEDQLHEMAANEIVAKELDNKQAG